MKYESLVSGGMPPFLFRLVKKAGNAINRFGMIHDGDSILIGMSGGKDSLFLALCLSLRLRWLPVRYRIEAVTIEWEEHPFTKGQKDMLSRYLDALGIRLSIIREPQRNSGFKGEFNCYLCSRNRRRLLFNFAEKAGIRLIALGHHLDDAAETVLMNLAFRARADGMSPVQDFFSGKFRVIRPLCLIDEASISRACDAFELPVIKSRCPFDKVNIRSALKPVISELSRQDRYARKHMFEACCSKPSFENPSAPLRSSKDGLKAET